MRILSVLFLMIFVSPVYAQELVCGDSCADEIPTCETLGYKQGMYCPEGYTVCPYDSSYVWCKTYSCEDAGFFSTAGADTEEKINLGYVCRKTEYHGLTCFDCSECEADPKLCRYSEVNKGEGKLEGTQCCNGYYTGCKQTCNTKDKSATVPAGEGVLKKTETCSSCGVEEIIVTGWECDTAGGYQLSADGKSCVEMPCPTPTEQPDVLYQEGNVSCDLNRWYVDSINYYRKTCSRCLPNACETGYSTDATCADTKGYRIVEQGYSGNDSCKKCVEKTCNTGYSTNYQSIADCQVSSAEGWTADKAWTWTEDAQNGSGELKCGKCTPKSCPTDYSENISCSNGYTIEYSTEGFYGDKTCGKCVASICSDGAKTDLTVDQCGYSGLIGASVKETGELSGGKVCQKCECASSGCNVSPDSIGQGTGIDLCCNGNYKNCDPGDLGSARDFDTNKDPNMNDDGYTTFDACGKTYYTITSCKDGFKKDGNYCVQKTCADYGLKSNQNSCDEGFKAVNSTEHLGCYQCVAKTCADYDSTWKLDNGASCPTGYKKAYHTGQMLGNSQQTCYDCNSCQELSGYISVSSESDIPSYVTAMNVQFSCEQPKYCATGCADGYELSGCSCQSGSCGDGYYATSTPMMAYGNKGYYTPSNVAQARRGASLYLRCQSGDNYLYKFDQCNQTLDFMSETDCYKKTNGSNGWDWNSVDGLCGTCTAKDCPTDYSEDYQSIADCPTLSAAGWTANKAWTFSAHSNQYAGELKCGKCTAKSCGGGYSVSATCDESSYTTEYSSDYFNGTNLCKKCVARSCPEGTGTGLTVSQCNYPATYGASVVPSGSKSGNDDCLECSCSASDCTFDSDNKGQGTLSDQCCNGKYKTCIYTGSARKLSTLGGDEHVDEINEFTACGERWFTVESCDEGYKLEDNVCIEKPCSDYGLKSSDTACGDGYKAVASTEHPGCYDCQAKTCADYDMQPTNSCSTGYTASSYSKQLGAQTKTCYKCDQCEEWTGYKSSTQNYWSEWSTKYSCTTPKYCATKCAAGYDGPSSCDCTIHSCGDGYVAMNDARKVSGLDYYTDSTGASLFEKCQSGGDALYKFVRCYTEQGYKTASSCYNQTNGMNGWTWTDFNSHGCGTCVAKSCPLGYTGGWTSANCECGQAYEKSTTYAGTEVCGKCTKIACSSGYNAIDTSFEKDGINYGPISYWTATNLGTK